MQMAVLSRNPIFKNIPNNPSKQNPRFFPYKTQSYRWGEYRKSRISILKKLNQHIPQQSQLQSTREISLIEKQEKSNPQLQKQPVAKETTPNKSPLLFKKVTNNSNSKIGQAKYSESKLATSILQPVPLFIQQEAKSPQFKLYTTKLVSQNKSKEKEGIFRKTFCTSLHKPSGNRSLEIRSQQKRPPTSNLQAFRPATRIRKVSNIGEESNSNFLAKYEIIKQLGKGTYGTVYLARVIKKKDQLLPNLFNSTFFNSSNRFTASQCNDHPRILTQSKPRHVEYFSSITQNQSTLKELSTKASEMPINLQSVPEMQTLQEGDQIPIIRQDHHVYIENNQTQQNNSLKQNLIQQPQNDSWLKANQAIEISDDDQLVAIKVYEKFKMNKDPAKFKNIRKQITIMQNLNHPGVIKLYESVESITKISLVVEFGGQLSLLDYLRKNFPLSQQKIRDFSRQLLQILIYLHEKNIVHRDIKPQNILVKFNKHTNQQSLKLIDYGFSTLTNKTRKLNAICGTPNFMAPELLSSKQYFGEKADVWSYGIVAFVMAEGRHPFKSQEYQQLTRLVNKGKYVFKKKQQPLFEQFIGQILKLNSDQRPTAVQVSKFKWLQQQ